MDDGEWEESVVRIEPGETLLFYTDGVTDLPGADDRFGDERLIETAGLRTERRRRADRPDRPAPGGVPGARVRRRPGAAGGRVGGRGTGGFTPLLSISACPRLGSRHAVAGLGIRRSRAGDDGRRGSARAEGSRRGARGRPGRRAGHREDPAACARRSGAARRRRLRHVATRRPSKAGDATLPYGVLSAPPSRLRPGPDEERHQGRVRDAADLRAEAPATQAPVARGHRRRPLGRPRVGRGDRPPGRPRGGRAAPVCLQRPGADRDRWRSGRASIGRSGPAGRRASSMGAARPPRTPRRWSARAIEAAVRAAVIHESGGNPFYLEQLARAREPDADPAWRRRAIRSPGCRARSRGALTVELAGAPRRRAHGRARALAVAGDEADPELIAAVAGADTGRRHRRRSTPWSRPTSCARQAGAAALRVPPPDSAPRGARRRRRPAWRIDAHRRADAELRERGRPGRRRAPSRGARRRSRRPRGRRLLAAVGRERVPDGRAGHRGSLVPRRACGSCPTTKARGAGRAGAADAARARAGHGGSGRGELRDALRDLLAALPERGRSRAGRRSSPRWPPSSTCSAATTTRASYCSPRARSAGTGASASTAGGPDRPVAGRQPLLRRRLDRDAGRGDRTAPAWPARATRGTRRSRSRRRPPRRSPHGALGRPRAGRRARWLASARGLTTDRHTTGSGRTPGRTVLARPRRALHLEDYGQARARVRARHRHGPADGSGVGRRPARGGLASVCALTGRLAEGRRAASFAVDVARLMGIPTSSAGPRSRAAGSPCARGGSTRPSRPAPTSSGRSRELGTSGVQRRACARWRRPACSSATPRRAASDAAWPRGGGRPASVISTRCCGHGPTRC